MKTSLDNGSEGANVEVGMVQEHTRQSIVVSDVHSLDELSHNPSPTYSDQLTDHRANSAASTAMMSGREWPKGLLPH